MASKEKFNADIGLKTDADLQVDGNVTVTGDFTVNGTSTTINATTTSVEDNMLELANSNTSSDTIDIGIYGNYDDGLSDGGASEYTGLFRDASDSTWKLFDGLEEAPTTTVNTSGTGYTLADLQVGDLTATTLTATNSLTGASISYPTSDGTNGQVLTTDGSGTLSFSDIPAGYTDSDARSAISVSGDLSYDSSTGVISYSDSDTTYTDSDARSAISGGTGISYDSSTGVITNTVSNTDTTYSAGTGLSLSGTTFSSTITQYADSDVESYLDGGTSTPTFASAIVDGDVQIADGGKLVTKTTSGEVIRFERASDSLRYSSIHANSTDAGGAFIQFKVHTGASATSLADVMTLKGSGKVGIGTSNPTKGKIEISGASYDEGLLIERTDTSSRWGLSGNDSGSFQIWDDNQGDSTRLVIDSSGNLLVGKTALNNDDTGVWINPNGTSWFTSDGAYPIGINRKSSDGQVLVFTKDQATAGQINSLSGRMAIGSGDTGIFFDSTRDCISPFTMSGNDGRTDAIDLGRSNVQFKDLYLSGGAYLGGTGSANHLDDYEEGTFTPVVGNGTYTYSFRRGHYVKIGNLVHVHIGFKLNTASSVGTSTASISGLPFTSGSYGSYQEPHARVGVAGLCVTANLSYNLSFYVNSSDTVLYARSSANNTDGVVTSNNLWQNGTFIKLQMCYTVS